MAQSKKAQKSGWSELLDQASGAGFVYDEVLDLALHQAGPPLRGEPDEILGSSDQAVAAISTLRGHQHTRGFLEKIKPVISLAYRKLSMFPESIQPPSMLALLSLVSISETVGAGPGRPTSNVTAKFGELAADEFFADEDLITLALLAIEHGHAHFVSKLFLKNTVRSPKRVGQDPVALLRSMAAIASARSASTEHDLEVMWNSFLHDFPALLAAKQTEWRHLLLAARFVMTTLQNIPLGQVAETLHRRVVELAAAE